MWMGEQITKHGIGNGISILIFASILTSAPAGINAWVHGSPVEKLFFPIVALGVVVSVVFVQEGQRRIPIQYAKRMVGRRQMGGQSTYMPLRVNMAGVIPVIFAAALLALPQTIGSFLPNTQNFINAHFSPRSWTYLAVEAGLIMIFTFFYTAVQFNPVDQAERAAQVRRLHPRHPAGPADRGLPRPRADAPDAARLALPRDRGRAPVGLHQLLQLLAGHLARPRRHLGADRRRRRPRHDAPDGVADDDALLRRLPPLAMNLLVLGPQGAGKGTQAKRIAADYAIPHVSTGDMFRDAIAARSELGLQVEPILASGTLVPDEITIALIRDRLAAPDALGGFVLDGFPRNDAQADELDAMLAADRPAARRDPLLRPPRRRRDRADARARRDREPPRRHPRGDRQAARDLSRRDGADRRALPRHGPLVPLHAERTIPEVYAEIQDALAELEPAA